jgi:hypothetical protein
MLLEERRLLLTLYVNGDGARRSNKDTALLEIKLPWRRKTYVLLFCLPIVLF